MMRAYVKGDDGTIDDFAREPARLGRHLRPSGAAAVGEHQLHHRA